MRNPFLFFCIACLAGLLSTGLQAQVVDSSGNNSWNFPGLNVPSNIHTEVTYDPVTGMYKLQRFIGSTAFGAPTFLTAEQYQAQVYDNQELATWRTRWAAGSAADQREGPSMVPDMTINNPAIKEVFGSDELDIRPQGSAQLKFGLRYQNIDNPIVPERNRKTLAFDFDQDMQINATGKLGDRLDIKLNYDTKATFAFENKMKLNFTGLEDDIVKSLEMGDVSLPTGGSLITGAQSLFGLKGKFQFGNTTVTTVMAEQRSQGQSLNIQGGGTTQEFSIEADNYEANRHFFMSHYFRDHYEDWLKTLPVIQSPIQITKVEIWLTNRRSTPTQVRNILAFLDLGEAESHAWRSTSAGRNGEAIFPAPSASNLPSNGSNRLAPDELTQRFSGIRNNASSGSILSSAGYDPNVEYAELSNARKLLPNEYSFHPQLGFITLNMALNQDEVLAIAYQYTANGRTYQVGEFSNDGVLAPQALVVKLLKHSTLQVKSPIWDLMMKNVYSLNAYQLSQEDFRLEIMYRNDATGMPIPFLPKSSVKDQLLVQVMGLDRVNSNGDPFPDGLFDFIPQVTVLPQTGRIILPVLEPFGSSLAKHLPTLAERKRYVFQQLYDSTLFRAQEQTQLNKFLLKGRYKGGGGSLIQLTAFNIPRGSINVTAGGRKLMENQDYTVDYALGQVRILNESLMSSGMPIKVNFENNSMFNMQAKTFAGTTVEHRLSKDWVVGGSLLRLSERPLTQKVNAGDEPISNRIWGLNSTFNQDLPSLTRALDALPFVSTNAPSKVQLTAEFAQLLPGSPRGIKINGEATTYLDDFESSQTTIDLRGTTTWHIASTPEGLLRYPEASLMNDWASNANRGRLSWYIVDPSFYASNGQTPQNIRNDPSITSDHKQRMVPLSEVFPNIPLQPGMARNIAMFDVQFDPTERGAYNFDVNGFPGLSSGIASDGSLNNPASRWGGLMRQLTINNFEEQNIEFIQFWVMDPFLDDPSAPGGDLVFHLGNLSEDILKDGRQSFEHGLNPQGLLMDVDSSVWGYTSRYQPVTTSFDNDPSARSYQDVGLDGLNDQDEQRWLGSAGQGYLSQLNTAFGASSAAYASASADPAADNFTYYRGEALDQASADILQRYRYWNNPDGNSQTTLINGLPATYTNLPDREDVNQDNTLNKAEQYFQYTISMRPQDLVIGQNNVSDIYETTTDLLPDNTRKPVRWIQFKIPVFAPDQRVNGASDFRSLRFLRMVLQQWQEPVVMRFARLELVRGEWRRYRFSLEASRELIPVDQNDGTTFSVNAVNLEENGGRQPIPYMLPPGIDREVLLGNTSLVQQNEQSLSMDVCNLRDGDARAVFKNTSIDMRMNKRLKLFTHVESTVQTEPVLDGDLHLFIRLGNDYNLNYYEFEIPLQVTAWGEKDPGLIWPEGNIIDLPFSWLTELKLARNAAMVNNPNVSSSIPYELIKDEGIVRVVGSPNLGDVRTVLIGVRNPKKRSTIDGDDGLSKCAEIWINELRMVEFDNRGGMAALARGTVQLADLGQIALSGAMSTPGFGSLEMNPQERNKFTTASYDFQTQLDLDKFIPGRSRWRFPMFINHAQDWKTPLFNPLSPDVEMDRSLANLSDGIERDSLRGMVSDFTQRRGINFTNIHLARGGGNSNTQGRQRSPVSSELGGRASPGAKSGTGKPKPWDLENLSATYAYNEIVRRDVNTIQDRRDAYRGNLAYNYQRIPLNIAPFKGIKNKNLNLIRDINLNLTPSRVSARAEVNRVVQVMQMRNVDNPKFQLPTTYAKSMTMDRNYNLVWDLSKNFKLDYTGRMRVRVDELPGPAGVDSIDTYLLNNLMAGGRPIEYHHNVNASWPLPINKIPYLEFVQMQLRYQTDFDWNAQPLLAAVQQIDSLDYGNTIENSGKWTASANLNFNTFYNKFPFYKKMKQSSSKRGGKSLRAGGRTPAGDASQSRKPVKKEEERMAPWVKTLVVTSLDLITMVKSINVSSSLNTGSLLPGFNPLPVVGGLNPSKGMSPGLDYVIGMPVNIRQRSAENGWMVDNSSQPNRARSTLTRTLNARAQVEPVKDMRITLTAQQNYGNMESSTFRYSDGLGADSNLTNGPGYYEFSPMNLETFSTSWLAWSTAFETSESPDYDSDAYQKFLSNRLGISNEFGDRQLGLDPLYSKDFISDPDSSRYGYNGFSVLQSEVLFKSFLMAYGDGQIMDAGEVNLQSMLPAPNWRVNYTGLMRLKPIRKRFTAFNMTHGYTNTLTIAGVQTNMLRLQKVQDKPSQPFPIDANGDILANRQIGQMTMTEAFSPLIGVDVRTKTNASFKLEIGKNRQVAMSLANNQITESKAYDMTVGVGYIVRDLKFTLVDQEGQRTNIQSNLELKLDVRVSDNQTVIRRIYENFNQPTAGQRRTTVKFTADYRLSRRLTAQYYFDQTISTFKTSMAFPTNQWQSGIAFRLNLGN